MKKRTKIILPIIIVVSGFLVMKGLMSLRTDPPKQKPEIHTKVVETEIVSLHSVASKVTAYGRVVSSQPIELIAEVTGTIEKGDIPFKASQKFSKGDLILKIDDRQIRLDINSAKSDLLTALATVLPEIKIDFPDQYPIWQNYFNSCEFDKELAPLPEAFNEKIKLYLSRFNVYKLYYQIQNLVIRLEKHYFYAPFDGSIVSIAINAGSTARTGSILSNIISLEQLEVSVPVETRNVKWIDKNRPVILTSSELAGEWTGHISRIGSNIDKLTQTIEVVISLDAPQSSSLFNGVFLKADIPGKKVENSFAIPPKAVYEDSYIYLIVNGKLEQRNITVARRETDQAIISDGLKNGDTVVVEIMQGVSTGMPASSRISQTENRGM